MRRREFIAVVGIIAATWALAVRAQQPALPVIGFIYGGSPDGDARFAVAFRKGLSETGSVEGQNVTVEYHWLEGHKTEYRVAATSTPPIGTRAKVGRTQAQRSSPC